MMRFLSFALLLLPLLGGCAVRATSAILAAEEKLRAAETAGAATRAPYEYTLARSYLEKAKEETGSSDYGAAESLAQRAGSFADAALVRTGEAPAPNAAPPADEPSP
jgi:hypothetical protein